MNPEIWLQGLISRHKETDKKPGDASWRRCWSSEQFCEGEEGGVGQMVERLASQAQGLGGPVKDEEDNIMACREWNLCRCSKGKLLWVVCLNN